ncbi:MAG: Smr/MutS family protein [Bacteroidales bacterium]|nr:Smr/MutS family protein [Bacteroidales bacterium]
MIYPANFETRIGFDVVRHEVEKRCISPLGVTYCQQMKFSSQFDEVSTWLSQTNEFLTILQSKQEFPLNYFFDLRHPLKTISTPGSYISAENLFNLQRSLNTIAEIIRFFRTDEDGNTPYPHLKRLTDGMLAFPEIVGEANRILDKFGNVKDNASPLLRDLRSTIASTTASINGIMRRVIAQGRQAGIFDGDTAPSMRDGRLVLPVAPMHKRKVKGIVHDESASGKTVFIEPEEIVEANNRIRETEGEIKREIVRILTEVSDLIRPHIPDLLATYGTLGMFDFIRAKASFAQAVDGHMPHLQQKPHIEWYHAQHPALFLSLKEHGKEVVPLNIQLSKENRILIISGPNAGGKSVCLKTVGVVQYMMQCGILPTVYENSHMGMFRSVFVDIGDQQSIEDDLSTYSSHLQNMKTFLSRGGKETLILIDEFGGGTEPQIGAAIAQAILEQLNAKRMMGVITTHYQNLKHFADDTPGLVNGAMLYDRQRMQPLFQLSIGYPGSSFAIEIARKIGLPTDVIEKASELVGSDYINMDKYLLDIVRDRKYWENKRYEIHQKEKRLNNIVAEYDERLERIATEHKLIIKEAKNEAQEILKQSNAQIEQTIREIKEMQAEKEKTRQVRQQLDDFKRRLQQEDSAMPDQIKQLMPKKPLKQKGQKKPEKKAAPSEKELAVGDNVVMKGSTTVGNIMAIEGKFAIVGFGNLKTRVEMKKLERTLKQVTKPKETSSISSATSSEMRQRQLNFKPDIDVRGMRGDEAVQAITYFIDDAIQFSQPRVRILHGTGTGILKQLIRQYLNSVREVKSYRDEHVQFGGAGITVVDFE